MAQNTSLDLDAAIRFPFKDPKWLEKIAVAALLMLTAIGSIPVLGWAAYMQRTLIQTGKAELPSWDGLGDYFVAGLKYIALILILFIPLLLLIPLLITPALLDNEDIALIAVLCFQALVLAWSFIIAMVMPVISAIFADTLSIRATLNPRTVWRLFAANWQQFVGAAIFAYVVGMVASFGFLLLCVGIYFTSTISSLIMYHLYGQAYRNAKAKLA